MCPDVHNNRSADLQAACHLYERTRRNRNQDVRREECLRQSSRFNPLRVASKKTGAGNLIPANAKEKKINMSTSMMDKTADSVARGMA